MRFLKLILPLSLAVAACGPSKDYTYSKMELNPRVVANFCYRPGSYWIYKDSATGETAEMQITDTVRGTSNVEANNNITEREEIYITGRILHPASSGGDTTKINLDLINNNVTLFYSGGLPNHEKLFWGIYFYPVLTGPNFHDGFLWNDFFPSMTVNGHTYTNVLYSTLHDRDEYWVTEAEGIIRMHLRHPYETVPDRVYELDHFHIER